MLTKPQLNIMLAAPRGFCAGVERAITIVERALEKYGPPVYVRHEIVHNKRVIEDLKSKGAIFVKEISEIPEGAITIFSAHGVAKKVVNEAEHSDLHIIDATCPLVTKVHKEGQRHSLNGYDIILIGHEGHPEVEGTRGQIDGTVHVVSTIDDVKQLQCENTRHLAYITQTTLSVDDTKAIIAALKARFPHIIGPDVKDICYATQNRQQAVRELVKSVELLIVLGAKNSSNSNRLKEIGSESHLPSYLIDDAAMLQLEWLKDITHIGVTAGASAPETLIQEVIDTLKHHFQVEVTTLTTTEEHVHFKLPKELNQQ